MPAEPRTVPCLFCTKKSRRNPDSDYCTQCWDEWKRTGVKPKAVIHGDTARALRPDSDPAGMGQRLPPPSRAAEFEETSR